MSVKRIMTKISVKQKDLNIKSPLNKSMLKAGDLIIIEGKPYISLDMYKDLQKTLEIVQDTAEGFLQRLTDIEVAKTNRNSMRILTNN